MIRTLIRGYRPKIQFRVGHNKKNITKSDEVETAVAPVTYEKPLYLSLKKPLTKEEIDLLNQGGVSPAIHWRKVTPLTDIHLDY